MFTVAAIVVVGGVAGVVWYLDFISHATTDDAFLDGQVVPVSSRVEGHVLRVLVTDNQVVEAGETLVELDPAVYEAQRASAAAALAAAVERRNIADANVLLTQARTGAVLAEAQAGVAMAIAGVEAAGAAVTTAQSQVRQAEAQIESGKAQVEQAQAELDSAQAQADLDAITLRDLQQLAKAGAANQKELDDTTAAAKVSAANAIAARNKVASQEANVQELQAAAQVARDRLAEAQSMLTQAQARVQQANAALTDAQTGPIQVQVAQGQTRAAAAAVDQAQADLDQAALNVAYSSICAPLSGRVTMKSVEVGQHFEAGQPMLSIVRPDVWIIANFKETDLTTMRPGQRVSISIDAYPDGRFDGHVDSVQAGSGAVFSLLPPQNATGNYVKVVQRVPVKIVFDSQPDPQRYFLAPGMSVVPKVDLRSNPAPHKSRAVANDTTDQDH